MLSSHQEDILESIKAKKLVLIVQDITKVYFIVRKKINGVSHLNSKTGHGFSFIEVD